MYFLSSTREYKSQFGTFVISIHIHLPVLRNNKTYPKVNGIQTHSFLRFRVRGHLLA